MDIIDAIEQAEPSIAKRVEGFEGSSGTCDAILKNYGDYSLTLSCIALLNPEIEIVNGCPIAKFPGSKDKEAIDCFHVDLLHHSAAEGNNPDVLKAIGIAVAISWNQILKDNHLSGGFNYNAENGHDVEYRI